MNATKDTTTARVLIVEDEEPIRHVLVTIASEQYHVDSVADAESALALVRQSRFDVLVTDVRLPGLSGIDLIPRITHLCPGIGIIVVSGKATVEMAVDAMKRGAIDFLTKPFAAESLRSLLQLAVTRARRGGPERAGSIASHEFVAMSDSMKAVLQDVDTIARFNTSVLITGETGTGKELIARRVHAGSTRAHRAFVALNCAAVPEPLLEDELFGHVRGAFTGAQDSRVGRFEQADGGTLFLDEIADMALPLQTKLLRVIQEREFERLGSGQTVRVDVRILAASSGDLEERMRLGTFRPDLYYRLNVVRLDLPPLRDRPADIAPLADHFLAGFCDEMGLPAKLLSPDTYARLLVYDWPGNARQLRNAMERAAAMTGQATVIYPCDLPREVQQPGSPATATPASHAAVELPPINAVDGRAISRVQMDSVIRGIERRLLFDALDRANGNKLQAAKLLGIKRTTFAARLRRARDTDA